MKKFLKVSLSISLAGILLLLFISNIIQPKIINIKEINNRSLNQKVQVSGQITEIKSYKESEFQILSIKDETGEIEVTLDKILDLTNIKQIKVIGTVTEYKGKLQIQAEKIISF